MTVLNDVGLWLWRLLPANPILVRVVNMGGKRIRHLWARLIYLGVLFVVMILSQNFLFGGGGKSLAELAKNASQVFMYVSLVQLFLMSFIAPVFCAGAITQEKDANTFHILLTTPLSNGQIVLGSLFSRMYFIWVLLLAGLPIFGITMIYGGVTLAEVFASFGLAACTGLITGAMAIAISFLKIGTRRTIFSFFVGIAVYILGVWAIGLSSWGQLSQAPVGTNYFGTGQQLQMSWLAPIHPFLALSAVTGQTPPPAPADVHHFGWPWRFLLANPAGGYMLLTTLGAGLLVLLSLIFVRRGAKEGEGVIANRIKEFVRARRGDQRRKPRRVWRNPIAWREAATRASAGGRSWLRWIFSGGGVIAGLILLLALERGWWGLNTANPASFDLVRDWLIKLVWVQLAVVLLIVTNTAASTLTREKESQTMELLLTTPLTSAYIAWGMVEGLVRFVLPLIVAPGLTLALFVIADLFRRGGQSVVSPEAALLAPLLMLAFASTAAMIGLQFSLMAKKTVQAVMVSTGIVLGGTAALWGCGVAVINATPTIASFVLPFSPIPAMSALIDVSSIHGAKVAPPTADELAAYRITRLIATLIAAGLYSGITVIIYRGLVRSFDMTVRKQ